MKKFCGTNRKAAFGLAAVVMAYAIGGIPGLAIGITLFGSI